MSLPWFAHSEGNYSLQLCRNSLLPDSTALLSLPAPASFEGYKEFLAGMEAQEAPAASLGCGEGSPGSNPRAGSSELRLSPLTWCLVACLLLSSCLWANIRSSICLSRLWARTWGAKIHLSGLQPPPVTPCPLQVSAGSWNSQL